MMFMRGLECYQYEFLEDDKRKEQDNITDNEGAENVEVHFLIDRVLVLSTPFKEDGIVILLILSMG